MSPTLPILALTALLAQAPPSAGGERPRPALPLFQAIDVNGDGILDAKEIANAPAALRKLDKNGDGRLTPDEYRPPRPDGAPPAPPAQRTGSAPATGSAPRAGAASGSTERGAARPQGGGEGPGRPPRPLIDQALDANGDEIIDAGEIANAAAALRKLDKDGDGRLTLEECHPRPSRPRS